MITSNQYIKTRNIASSMITQIIKLNILQIMEHADWFLCGGQ